MISLTRTKIYDVDNDYDIEVERVDLIEQEEVLVYVPTNAKYRDIIVATLQILADDIVSGKDLPSGLMPDSLDPSAPTTTP